MLREALEGGAMRPVRRMIGSLHPSEVARLLESLPPAERAVVWELVDPDDEGDILVEVADEVRTGLIERMDAQELIAATEGMELDDLADLLAGLPEAVTRQVLRSLDKQDRDRLREVLSYPEDSAGGLMNKDTITVRPDVTLEVVVRYLRVHGGMPDQTESIFVVNRDDIFLGTLTLSRLLTNDPDLTVAEVMDTETKPIPAETSDQEVVRFFENRDLLSAAVVDMDNRLLGRITVDDVLDVIREEAEHSLMSRAGLDEEDDMFAPVVTSARRRAVWLGINLLTAFLAASVVDLFQGTVDAIVLLAVLMPVVPSMGGVAGTQSLTIITRAMALGQIDKSNARRILAKEVSVGILNGIGWAVVVAIVTVAWFGTWMVAAVIALALTLNMIVAAAAGFAVPLGLKRLGVDPAIAGGVVLTTVTDVVGLMVFLGMGTLLLL
jgi:magnesium transporter